MNTCVKPLSYRGSRVPGSRQNFRNFPRYFCEEKSRIESEIKGGYQRNITTEIIDACCLLWSGSGFKEKCDWDPRTCLPTPHPHSPLPQMSGTTGPIYKIRTAFNRRGKLMRGTHCCWPRGQRSDPNQIVWQFVMSGFVAHYNRVK